jgi:O-antigen/teichoic acid export membrane protein
LNHPAETETSDSSEKSRRTLSAILLSLGQLITVVSNIAIAYVLTRILAKADYATYRQALLLHDLAFPLIILGVPMATQYLAPRYSNSLKSLLILAILLPLISGLVFLTLATTYSDVLGRLFSNSDLISAAYWIGLLPLATTTIAILSPIFLHLKQTLTLSILTTFITLTTSIAVISSAYATNNPRDILAARAILQIAATILVFTIAWRRIPGSFRAPRPAEAKLLLSAAVPLGLATSLGTLTQQVHALTASLMSSPEEFAIYINGATEIPFIGIVTGAITAVAFTDLARHCAEKNFPLALSVFHESCKKTSAFLFPIMCFFFVAAEPFLETMYSSEYLSSSGVFRITLLNIPARVAIYGSLMAALGLSTAILLRSALDLLLTTLLAAVLTYQFGISGTAAALTITLYTFTIPLNLILLSQTLTTRWYHLLPLKELATNFTIAAVASIGPILALAYSNELISPAKLALAFASYMITLSAIYYLTFGRKYYVVLRRKINQKQGNNA